MSDRKIQARAVVKVTLEVTSPDNWGSDCSMDQVYKQGAEGAVGLLQRLIEKEPGIRIIGAPQVTAVLSEVTR